MAKSVWRLTSAAALDALMTKDGVTNSAMGRAAGHADHSYISRMRRGDVRARSVSRLTAERIAERLNIHVNVLFQEINISTGRPIGMPDDAKSVVRGAA